MADRSPRAGGQTSDSVMREDTPLGKGAPSDIDYASPEMIEAMRLAHGLVLDVARPLARKVALYERTLGFAVVPVLVRRALVAIWTRRQSVRGAPKR